MRKKIILSLLFLVGCSAVLDLSNNNEIEESTPHIHQTQVETMKIEEPEEVKKEPEVKKESVKKKESKIGKEPDVEKEPEKGEEPVVIPEEPQQSKQSILPVVPVKVEPVEVEPVVMTQTLEETEEIPFTVVEQLSQNIHWGFLIITQEGKAGTKTNVYEVTYTDGVETSRTFISEVISVQPQNQIIEIGQFVENFKNCTELRKVYPGGVYSDSPVYQKKYDRDGDGHGCEP